MQLSNSIGNGKSNKRGWVQKIRVSAGLNEPMLKLNYSQQNEQKYPHSTFQIKIKLNYKV